MWQGGDSTTIWKGRCTYLIAKMYGDSNPWPGQFSAQAWEPEQIVYLENSG